MTKSKLMVRPILVQEGWFHNAAVPMKEYSSIQCQLISGYWYQVFN